MAGKTHVDSAVAERRLRPIYDWLDNNNNKKALQEAEKVLKKQPNFLCAKVLKGLAYLRLGKEDECQALLDSVRAEEPSDDSTLQAMSICYRELHQPESVVGVYQAAVRKCPTNEELLTHLFMAYVRVGDLKKQQAQALSLYRLRPKNPYYFWAVMSIVMQAQSEDAGAAISLALAERMVARLSAEGRIEAEQEVHLYIMILEMQGKTEEALAVLEGPLAGKLVSLVSVPTKRCQLLVQLHRWKEANVLLKTLLLNDINQWALYQSYLDTGFRLAEQLEASAPALLEPTTEPPTMETLTEVATEAATEPTTKATTAPLEAHPEALQEALPDALKEAHPETNAEARAEAQSNTQSSTAADDKSPQQASEGVPTSEAEPETFEADDTWSKMASFLERLQGVNRQRERAERGPALARLELFRRMQERGLDAQRWLGPALHLLLGFVVKFGDRPCCVSDVRPYLALVPAVDQPELLALLTENVDLPCQDEAEPDGGVADLSARMDDTLIEEQVTSTCPGVDPGLRLPWELTVLPETRGQMLRQVVALQLARCVGAKPDSAHALRLERLHRHGTALCVETAPTEIRCNDGYALLAAHAHWDAWLTARANRDSHAVCALAALRRARAHSAHNAHVKLLTLRVLHELGLGAAAHEAYASLDVKHVQLDSMGHLHCALLAGTGQITHARALLDHTLKFFTTNHKDSVEHLTFSYKFGSFGKIAEFSAFRARLHASAHRAQSSASAALLALCAVQDWRTALAQLQTARGLARDLAARTHELSDNRDLGLLATWGPKHRCVVDENRAASFASELDLLRLRCALLTCVADAVLGPSEPSEPLAKEPSAKEPSAKEPSAKELAAKEPSAKEPSAKELPAKEPSGADLLWEVCERCQGAPAVAVCAQARLSAPLDSRLSVWPWDATRAFVEVARNADGGDDSCLGGLHALATQVSTLCADIEMHKRQADPITAFRRLMQRCVSLAEMLSLTALLVVGRRMRTAPPPTTAPRRNRRRKEATAPPSADAESAALAAMLASLAAAVESWPSSESSVDVEAFDPQACDEVRSQIAESRSSAVREVSAWLDTRLKFLELASSPH